MNLSSVSSPWVRRRTLLLLALCLLVYVPWNGLRDMWYPDEPDIAEVAQSMFETGDWISPRRMGTIWVDYPPLVYWAGGLSSLLLGGVSDFSLRLPNALAAAALVLLVCAVASRWYDEWAGWWAGFTLLTSLQFAYNAVGYRPDALFSLCIGGGLLLYASAEEGSWAALRRVGAFALFGLALLAKGPLGLLLPGLVLTLWHASRRRWLRLVELAPLSLVALALYLPWFAACAKAMGSENMLAELYGQNLERFQSGERGHGQPVTYYFVAIWQDLLPWSFLLPFAIYWHTREDRWRDSRVQLLGWWLGAFVVFLSFAATKRQLYLMPTYAAVSLLFAPWLSTLTLSAEPEASGARIVRWWARLIAVMLAVGAAALTYGAISFRSLVASMDLNPVVREHVPALRLPVAGLAVVCLAAALWITLGTRRWQCPKTPLLRVGFSTIALYLAALAVLLPAMDPIRSYRTQGEWIAQKLGDETHFGMVEIENWGIRKMGGFGYYSKRLVELMTTTAEVESFFRRRPGSVVLVSEPMADSLFADDPPRWRARVERELWASDRLYFAVVAAPPRDLGDAVE